MYWGALSTLYAEVAELVGLCDVNQTRMDYVNHMLQEMYEAQPVPTYRIDQFDQMVAEQKPDVVIVTSMQVAPPSRRALITPMSSSLLDARIIATRPVDSIWSMTSRALNTIQLPVVK